MSVNKPEYPCGICKKEVISDAIECTICRKWIHRICGKLTKRKLEQLGKEEGDWYCELCKHVFPFQNIDDDEFTYINDRFDVNYEAYELYSSLKALKYEAFSYTSFTGCDYENGIDPENNFLTDICANCDYYTDKEFNIKFTNNDDLSILNVNCRSLKSNFQFLKEFIGSLEKHLDIITVTETWLTENENLNEYVLNDYNFVYKNRKNKRGGGVGIFISNSLKFSAIDSMTEVVDNLFECITVELIIEKGKNILLSCIYRSPGTCLHTFIEHFEKLFSWVKNNKSIILCGDFNVDLLKFAMHSGTKDFIDVLHSLGLFSLITYPTRVQSGSATLIDNIFTNIMDESESGILVDDSISDHLPIFSLIKYKGLVKQKVKTYKYIRLTNDERINGLRNELSNYEWSQVFRQNNVDEAYDNFVDIVKNLYNKYCPLKKVLCSKSKQDKPWVSKSLKKCCLRKKELHKKYVKNNSLENEKRYKKYRNKLTSVLRFCEKKHYSESLAKHSSDTKRTWQILNEVIKRKNVSSSFPDYFLDSKNKKTEDKQNIANGFNDFFTNVGPKLANDIENVPDKTIYDYLNNPIDVSIFLNATTENEVIDIVKGFKNKLSMDCDDIDMNIVKKIVHEISKPLSYICDLSLSSGVFPQSMKTAKVIPLFKSGDKHNYSNYRPVSVLSQFSKILEKLFYKRLINFVDKNNILTESQYGFRSNRSTSSALIELIDNITRAIDEKEITVGIFIDLKKAFDTIDHKLLIKKLEYYGVRGVASSWIESYLFNRQQYVKFNGTNSIFSKVLCGVPQGSILGPLLFILYINDLCNVSEFIKFILFADDTNLFMSGKDIQLLSETLNRELIELNIWFKVNKLSLNVKKTNFIVFSKSCINNQCSINIAGEEIEQVTSTKFLGVIIDEKLTWKNHILHVKQKLSKCISIIYRSGFVIDQSALYILYCSLFLPYLSYCLEVWGLTYKSNTECIVLLQKKVIRIIAKVNKFAETTSIFKNLGILKFRDLVKLKVGIFMYKVNRLLMPVNILSIFTKHGPDERYTLRSIGKFKTNYVRTTLRSHTLSVTGTNFFNGLSDKIRLSKNVGQFKKYLKRSLLEQYD